MSAKDLDNTATLILQPIVLVIASPDVERTFAKSNLKFAEVLKPLGKLSRFGAVPFNASRPIQLKNVGVKFVSAAEVQAIDARVADVYLDNVLRLNQPGNGTTLSQLNCSQIVLEIVTVSLNQKMFVVSFVSTRVISHRGSRIIDTSFWKPSGILLFSSIFIFFYRFSELGGDLIDCPVGVVMAVSSQEREPLKMIEAMKQVR
jgi:hypothetical protein